MGQNRAGERASFFRKIYRGRGIQKRYNYLDKCDVSWKAPLHRVPFRNMRSKMFIPVPETFCQASTGSGTPAILEGSVRVCS